MPAIAGTLILVTGVMSLAAATALLPSLGMAPFGLEPVGAMVAGVLLVGLLGAWFQSARLPAVNGLSATRGQ